MILGASVYQVPLIKTANSLGIRTIVSSIPGNYPGFDFACKSYHANTIDKDAILKIAEEENIDGITTSGTDVAVATIGYVNEKMGLSGVSLEAAGNTTDKAEMKEAFRRGGVCASDFYRVSELEEARAAAEKIGYPVVVKCVDSSGSRGINTVKSEDGLEYAFNEAMRVSRKGYVLVEEMLKGHEIGVDGIVSGGRILFLAPHLKFTYQNGGTTITAGHAFPYRADKAVLDEIRRQIELAVRALKIDNCAFNSDLFVDGDRVSIIEVGGRAGATCIPELISRTYGFDYYEAIISCALGEPVHVSDAKARGSMAKLLMSPVDGIITDIKEDVINELRERGIDIALDYGKGQAVEAMINGTTRIGHVVAFADMEEELDELMRNVYRCIYVDGISLEERWEK